MGRHCHRRPGRPRHGGDVGPNRQRRRWHSLCQLNGTAWQRTLPGFPVNLEEALVTLWLFDMYIYIYSCSTAMEARLWPVYIDDKNDDLPTVKKRWFSIATLNCPWDPEGTWSLYWNEGHDAMTVRMIMVEKMARVQTNIIYIHHNISESQS